MTCSGAGGSASSSLTVTAEVAPTAILERNIDNSFWSNANAIINAGDQVSLKWSGANSTGCSGTGFTTAGNISGTDDTIIEPAPGVTNTYTVTCLGGNSSNATDSLTISTIGAPTITADSPIIKYGGSATIAWDNKSSSGCHLTGRDLPLNTLNSINGAGNQLVTNFETNEPSPLTARSAPTALLCIHYLSSMKNKCFNRINILFSAGFLKLKNNSTRQIYCDRL